MSSVWLKIRIWMKMIIFGLIALYVLIFVLKNSGEAVPLWVWFGPQSKVSVLVLLFVTFLIGVVGTLLVRTIFTTVRQIKEAQVRSRSAKMEREFAEMKSKAAKLQTKPTPPATSEPEL